MASNQIFRNGRSFYDEEMVHDSRDRNRHERLAV